jgi:threonine dehydrogenase-like Zn-dependent dehydrogenase
LVKVEYCGICGSDIHQVQYGMEEPGDLMMGHEGSGVLAAVGKNVSGWSEGDRVIIKRVHPCGRCWHCHNHLSSMCRNKQYTSNGAYAEYLTCTDDHLYRLPDDVSLEAAALWNPLTNALHAVQISSLKLGDLAVVIGTGPIGLFTIASARRAGAAPVLATEILPRRAEAARKLGATVLDPLKDDVMRAITDIKEFGADVAFECAGASGTLQEAIQYVRPGGQVALIGIHMEFFQFSTLLWVMKEIDVQAAFGMTDELPLAVEMLRDRTIKTEDVVSSIIPLRDLPGMMKKLFGPNDEIKVLVKP